MTFKYVNYVSLIWLVMSNNLFTWSFLSNNLLTRSPLLNMVEVKGFKSSTRTCNSVCWRYLKEQRNSGKMWLCGSLGVGVLDLPGSVLGTTSQQQMDNVATQSMFDPHRSDMKINQTIHCICSLLFLGIKFTPLSFFLCSTFFFFWSN